MHVHARAIADRAINTEKGNRNPRPDKACATHPLATPLRQAGRERHTHQTRRDLQALPSEASPRDVPSRLVVNSYFIRGCDFLWTLCREKGCDKESYRMNMSIVAFARKPLARREA
jgi:hypothetical protein